MKPFKHLSPAFRDIIVLISADDSEVRHDGTLESLLAEAWRLIMWGRFCSPNRVRLKQKCNQAYSFSNVAVRSLLLDLHALKQHSLIVSCEKKPSVLTCFTFFGFYINFLFARALSTCIM